MISPTTRSLPKVSAAIQAVRLESIPPDKPKTTVLKSSCEHSLLLQEAGLHIFLPDLRLTFVFLLDKIGLSSKLCDMGT